MRSDWPNGAEVAVSLTFDVDAESGWLGEDAGYATRLSTLSEAAFGPTRGVPRILEILEKHGIKGTFYVPGDTAERHTEAIRRIRDEGHEIGHHGYLHKRSDAIDAGQQREEIERGLEALDRTLGVRPAGYRSPSWELTPTTLGLLVATRDEQVVAWTSFGSGRDPDGLADGEVYGIYADPSAWSTGAGHALLEAAEQRISDSGYRRAYLWVLDGNERADAFYARHGWVEDGAIKIEERPQLTMSEHRRVKPLR